MMDATLSGLADQINQGHAEFIKSAIIAIRKLELLGPDGRRSLCNKFQPAQFIVMLDQVGWDPERIAEFLGLSIERVARALDEF
jgi:hypothetical protein